MFQITLQNVIHSLLICTLSFSLYLCNFKSMIAGEHEPLNVGAANVRDRYPSQDEWYPYLCV